MNRDRHKRLYDLHSWIGILIGLFLFVVSFTGTAALFGEEIVPWENPSHRLSIPEDPIAFDPILQTVFAEIKADEGEISFLRVDPPQDMTPYYTLYASYKDADGERTNIGRHWNASTGEVLSGREDGMSHWIVNFHRYLMLPSSIGLSIVGIAGIIMLVSAVTGIFIHGKIIREFFTLRLKRSQRLKWQDSHKVLGILGLPFSLMVAFTGAFLGVVSLLGPVIAVIAFQGNTEALFEKVIGAPDAPSGETAQMLSVDDIFKMRFPDTEITPVRVLFENYGDKNAHYDIFYDPEKKLATFEIMSISGVTGEPVHSETGIAETTSALRVINAITPLHYASYGGIWLKWVYAFMGASLCIMIASGLMLWVERRQHGPEGHKSDRFYEIITRTNIGICFGFPLATIALFYHDKLYLGAETARLYWTGVTYFTVVFGVLAFAFVQRNHYKTSKYLMVFCGALLLVLPLLNTITTGAELWTAEGVGDRTSNRVDISLFALGLLTIFSATRIPVKRNAEKKKRTKQ